MKVGEDVEMDEVAAIVEDPVDIAYKKSHASLLLAQRLFEAGALRSSGAVAEAETAVSSILAEIEKNGEDTIRT